MTPKVSSVSKHPRGGVGPLRPKEFNVNRFLGPDQQGWCEVLKSQRFLSEKSFIISPIGKFIGLALMIKERGCGKLVEPLNKVNYDVVYEFYANTVPRESEPFRFETYVRGKHIKFDREAINEASGIPSNLGMRKLDEFAQALGRHQDFDAMARMLLQEGRNVHVNNVGVSMRYAREDMTTEAQVLLLVLYNIKSKFHRSTAPIYLAFLVFSILEGTQIDVARIIANEMKITMEKYRQTGGKNPSPLIFPSLITSLCLAKWVQFPMFVSVTNPGAIDDEYIERYCVLRGKKKSGGESSAPVRETGGSSGGNYESYDPRHKEICNYNRDMMEAQQRAFTQLHASMETLQIQFRNPTKYHPLPTYDAFRDYCAWPEGRRPFYSGGSYG